MKILAIHPQTKVLIENSSSEIKIFKKEQYFGKILKVVFNSGFGIKLLPSQKLIDGELLRKKEVSEFKVGDFVLAPLDLKLHSINLKELENALKNKIKLIPELGYIFGFLFGDGHIDRNENRFYFTQSLKHKKYVEKLKKCWKKVTGTNLHEYIGKRIRKIEGRVITSPYIRLFRRNKKLIKLYDELIGSSLEKLIFLPENVLKEFIAGIFDSDGCISIKKSGSLEAKFMISNDIETNLNFMLALRRFGIYSKLFHSKDKVKRILIQNRKDIKILQNIISKYSEKIKGIKIPKRLKEVPSRSDRLPSSEISKLCKKVLDDIKTKTALLNNCSGSSIYQYKNLKRIPYRDSLGRILVKLSPHLSIETRKEMEKILRRDTFLDKIVKIKEDLYKGDICLLCIQNNRNIILNGVFVCN